MTGAGARHASRRLILERKGFRCEVAPCGVMADDGTSGFQAGRTGLVVRIPEAEAAIGSRKAIAERWPEAPPYGGRFAGIIPHLTAFMARPLRPRRFSRRRRRGV
ncbi:hypothetical protein GCM10022244_03680 [Streptomyces gulbargensis]|uniref:Uncharacterized protein n=1 Tax=Streptomyces gulbargensis TaxID=364901 RepID=A0ABP7L8A5_9ACTN